MLRWVVCSVGVLVHAGPSDSTIRLRNAKAQHLRDIAAENHRVNKYWENFAAQRARVAYHHYNSNE